MLVKEAMKKEVKGVGLNQNILDAAAMMKKFKIGSLPVLENKRLIGIITDRDIVLRCVAEGKKFETTKVEECMTKELFTIDENKSLEDASKMMCDHKVRRLIVVDKNATAIGMINLNHIGVKSKNPDLVMSVIQEFKKLT